MASRGDVLVARKRLGFGAVGRREHFVVVQADLVATLDTALVLPLDEDGPSYRGHDLAVPLSGREAGMRAPQVALVHLLSCMPLDRFDATRAGRASSSTMARIDGSLRLVLSL